MQLANRFYWLQSPQLTGRVAILSEPFALSAAPAGGWRFRFWSGSGIADTNAPVTAVVMDAAKLVTAHFGPAPPQATVILVQ